MLSLAALRYRNVLAVHGGPVERIETGVFPVCSRRMTQANARLSPGLTPKRARSIYSDADGSGTHPRASVARHMAVSEALERWAFHSVVRSPRAAEFGFDVDPSSNGMSAFPGLVRTNLGFDHRTGDAPPAGPSPMDAGLDPALVAGQVLDAIRRNDLYIITHGEFGPDVAGRAARLQAAFDAAADRGSRRS